MKIEITNIFVVTIFLIFSSLSSSLAAVHTYVNANGRVVSSQTPGEENTRVYRGSRYKFAKSKEKTAEDVPLEFTMEKTEYEYGRLKIWGNVANKINGRPYQFVKVTFSIWGGRGGTLMAREYIYTEPTTIGPGQIGYIVGYGIKCNPRDINLIEYQVTGR